MRTLSASSVRSVGPYSSDSCDGFGNSARVVGALCGRQVVALGLVQAAELPARYDYIIINITIY